jgi:hypothetical protein
MARPLLGTKPRIRVSVMMDPDDLVELDARRGTTSRSSYIAALIATPAPKSLPIEDTAPEPPLRERLQASINAVRGPCTHPKAARKVTSFGVAICTACDTKVP